MSVLDFLFEGSPPEAVTTYGETVEGMPKWMSDYTQGLIAKANAIAAEPYQPYGGPRIAGFTPEQKSAFAGVKEMQGAWRPGMDQARDVTSGTFGASALEEAAPWMNRAGSAATQAGRRLPGNIDEYMDPYIQNVLDRNTEFSRRTFEEQFLPGLQGAFTGANQFGSDRMMDLGVRGTRDIMENLDAANRGALSEAYGQAGTMFQADADRMLGLTGQMGNLAATSGQLAATDVQMDLDAARQYGDLTQNQQNMEFRDLAGLEGVGATQQGLEQGGLDLAYQDFLRQQGYPWEQVEKMASTVRGLPFPRITTSQQDVVPDVYQPSGLSQLGALATGVGGFIEAIKK